MGVPEEVLQSVSVLKEDLDYLTVYPFWVILKDKTDEEPGNLNFLLQIR